MLTFVPEGMKELSDRRMKLALQIEIPDMKAYAEQWNKLGADFEAAGAKANAEICFRNWKRYGGFEDAYRRKVQGNFSELIPAGKKVLVQIDGETAIRFPDVDKFAGWIAEIIAPTANEGDFLADSGQKRNETATGQL
jgi:hypothetical protein